MIGRALPTGPPPLACLSSLIAVTRQALSPSRRDSSALFWSGPLPNPSSRMPSAKPPPTTLVLPGQVATAVAISPWVVVFTVAVAVCTAPGFEDFFFAAVAGAAASATAANAASSTNPIERPCFSSAASYPVS